MSFEAPTMEARMALKGVSVSTTGQLRTQLSALQSSFHQTTSELSVLQSRIEVCTACAEEEGRLMI